MNPNFNQQQQNFLFQQQQQLLQNQARQQQQQQQQQMGFQPNDWRLMTTEATRRAVVDHLFQAVFNEMPESQKTEQERQKVLLMASNFENDEFQKAATQQIYVQNIRERMASIQQKLRQSHLGNARPIPIQPIQIQGLNPQQQQQYLMMAQMNQQMNPQYAQLLQQQQQNAMTPQIQQLMAAQGRAMMNPAQQFQQRAQPNIQPIWQQPVAPQTQIQQPGPQIQPIDLNNTGLSFAPSTQPPPKKLTPRQQTLLSKQIQKNAAKAASLPQTQSSMKDPAILREIESLLKNRVINLKEVHLSKPEAKVTSEMILELKPIYDKIDDLIYDIIITPDQKGDKGAKIDKIIGMKKILTAQYECLGRNIFYLNKTLCGQVKSLLLEYKQGKDIRPKVPPEIQVFSVPSPQESLVEKEQQKLHAILDPILKRDFGTDDAIVQSLEQEKSLLPGFRSIELTDIKIESYCVQGNNMLIEHAEFLFGPCKIIKCNSEQVESTTFRDRLLDRIPGKLDLKPISNNTLEKELEGLKTDYGLEYSINLLGANTSVILNIGEIILAVSISNLNLYLSHISQRGLAVVLVLDMIEGVVEEKKMELNLLIKNGAVIKVCVDFLIGTDFMDR